MVVGGVACGGTPVRPDLAQHVQIRRDTFGVPHILGQTEAAAAFGMGYAQAEDYGALLGELFLRARGRAAAVFGEAGIESDFRVAQFESYARAESTLQTIAPDFRAVVDGYAAGFNWWKEQSATVLPPWMPTISGADVLALSHYVLILEFVYGTRTQGWDAAQASRMGSNMWAVAPRRSASGHALLLANPHLPWRDHFILYEAQITVPGVVNATGATPIGCPVLCIARNERLGWSLTVNYPDFSDVYRLRLVPGNHEEYYFNGTVRPMRTHVHSVEVLRRGQMESQRRTFHESHLGAVIAFGENAAYVVRIGGLHGYQALDQWRAMAKATSLTEFKIVLQRMDLPLFNVCYADQAGNIFYFYGGRIGRRPDHRNWNAVVAAEDSTVEWQGYLSFDELPQLSNPRSGYLQNCNGSPWVTSLADPIAENDFPDYLGREGVDLRTQRSLRLLEADSSITLEDLCRYKFAPGIEAADRLKADLIGVLRRSGATGTDSLLAQAATVLETWDNTAAVESRGAELFLAWWRQYTRSVPRPFAHAWSSDRPLATPHGLADARAAVDAIRLVAQGMQDPWPDMNMPYGKTHRHRRGTVDLPIAGGPGNAGCFRVLSFEQDTTGVQVATGGDSFVMLVEFGPRVEGETVVPYGTSHVNSSPHYTDQMALFAAGRLKPQWFTEEEILGHLERDYRPGIDH